MADWVTNGLYIEGPAEEILRVKLHLGRAFKRELPLVVRESTVVNQRKEVAFSNPIFSFWNIINPLGDGFSIDGMKTATSSLNLYNAEWFEKAWGTSADVAVADGEEYPTTLLNVETDTRLAYQFDTAGTDCRQAIASLAVSNPSLGITYDYEYPEGEGGSISFVGSNMRVLEEYRWKCTWCDYIEKGEPLEECPECGEANDSF